MAETKQEPSKVPYVGPNTLNLEIAMIDAATKLTIEATGKYADDVVKNYRRLYATIVEAYNEVH